MIPTKEFLQFKDRQTTDYDLEDDHILHCSPALGEYAMNPRFIADIQATPSTGDTIGKVSHSGELKESSSTAPSKTAGKCHLLKLTLEKPSCKPAIRSHRIIYRTNLKELCGLELPARRCESSKPEGRLLPIWMLDSDIDHENSLSDGDHHPRNSVKALRENSYGPISFKSDKLKTFMELSEIRILQEKCTFRRESPEKLPKDVSLKKIEFNYSSFKKIMIPTRAVLSKLKPALKKEEAAMKPSQGQEAQSLKKTIVTATPKVSFKTSCMVMRYLPEPESSSKDSSSI